MTEHRAGGGSSLAQSSHPHHYHLYTRDHSRSLLPHSHNPSKSDLQPKPGPKEKRQDRGRRGAVDGVVVVDTTVTQVVQTVSLIRFVDQNGQLVTVVTTLPTPARGAADPAADVTDSVIDQLLTETPVEVPIPVPTAEVQSSAEVPLPPVAETPIDSVLPSEASTPESSLGVPVVTPGTESSTPSTTDPATEPTIDSTTELTIDPTTVSAVDPATESTLQPVSEPTIGPSPSLNTTVSTSEQTSSTGSGTAAPTFHTLAASFNSTQAGGFRNNTRFFNTTSTRTSTKQNTSTTTILSTSTDETVTDVILVATDAAFPEAGNGGGTGIPETVEGNLDPVLPTSKIVGSVFGGLAGAALIAFLIMALLRWKRRQMGHQQLGDGPTNSRGMITDGSTPGMTQRSVPFSVPGVLASLSGYKQHSESPAPASKEEKGFYRVSGKKLPSVLEHGGDGYTAPRHSVMSSTSHYSMYEGGNESNQILALGSPMRPVSGVPVIRNGPARTPVTEKNPFLDPPTPQSSNTLRPSWHQPDPIGRSLTFQDSSRVSSRFTEEV